MTPFFLFILFIKQMYMAAHLNHRWRFWIYHKIDSSCIVLLCYTSGELLPVHPGSGELVALPTHLDAEASWSQTKLKPTTVLHCIIFLPKPCFDILHGGYLSCWYGCWAWKLSGNNEIMAKSYRCCPHFLGLAKKKSLKIGKLLVICHS